MRIALLQMTSGIDPASNAVTLEHAIVEAAARGAAVLFTPEMSGLIDRDGARASAHVHAESDDPVLARVRDAARKAGIWVQLGSLPIKAEGDARWANRSFVIDSAGDVRARYDKMHLFDVDVDAGESWRESTRYRAGSAPTVTDTPIGMLGLSICYDMRFPALYQALSAAGATVIAVPAAFTVPTGQAHWHVLLRARAIENAAFVVAAAQTGTHADGRATFGHSLVIDPWGSVLCDMGEAAGLTVCDIDPDAVAAARARIPVLAHRREIGPLAS